MKSQYAILLLALQSSVIQSFVPSHPNVLSKTLKPYFKPSASAICAEPKPGSIGSLIDSTLKISEFVYTYGTIRRVVNDHDRLIRDGKPASKGFLGLRKKKLVDMYRPELVVTQRGSQGDDPDKYLNYPVTAPALIEFLRNNRQFLKQDEEGGDVEFQELNEKSENLPELYTEKKIDTLSKFDGEIVDYFDQTTNKYGFVYGITINRTMKRITVTFRGTVGGTDFLADANFNPNREHFGHLGRDVKVHSGFSGYLFQKLKDENRTRYDRIVAALKGIYDSIPESDRNGYKVVVSGHSLGGALANLFAFTLALREDEESCPLFHYVQAVTFAGPVVGNSGYNDVFKELERKKKLNMIRVSNQGDLVPTNPSPYEYLQNGVNMHVFEDKKMEVAHDNQKSLLSQVNLKALENHGFPTYESRIFKVDSNMEILNQSFDEVYQAHLP